MLLHRWIKLRCRSWRWESCSSSSSSSSSRLGVMEFTGNTKFALPRFQKVRALVYTLTKRREERVYIRSKESERRRRRERFNLTNRVAIDIERNVGHGSTCIPWMVEFAWSPKFAGSSFQIKLQKKKQKKHYWKRKKERKEDLNGEGRGTTWQGRAPRRSGYCPVALTVASTYIL